MLDEKAIKFDTSTRKNVRSSPSKKYMNATLKKERDVWVIDRANVVNKGFTIWDKAPKHDPCSSGTKPVSRAGKIAPILPVRVASHSARFGSSCPLTGLGI